MTTETSIDQTTLRDSYKARLNALLEEFRATAPHGITDEALWREMDAALDDVRIALHIERLEDRAEEARDLAEIDRRLADPEGPSVPLEEVKATLGF